MIPANVQLEKAIKKKRTALRFQPGKRPFKFSRKDYRP